MGNYDIHSQWYSDLALALFKSKEQLGIQLNSVLECSSWFGLLETTLKKHGFEEGLFQSIQTFVKIHLLSTVLFVSGLDF